MKPPQAPQRVHIHKDPFGQERSDNYHWLRNQEDPEVLRYLESENSYFRAVMADTESLQAELFEELKGRIPEADQSVPYRLGAYEYFTAIKEGQQYLSHHRKPINSEKSQLLLDENERAQGKEYFELGTLDVSPNHKLLLWGEDLNGSEHYQLRVKDLATNTQLPDTVLGASGSVAWLSDSSGFLYTLLNEKDRPDRVMLHILGQDPNQDQLIYMETNPEFFVSCSLSKDQKVLMITCSGKVTSETFWLPASEPLAQLRSIYGRKQGVLYHCESFKDGQFLMLTDDTEPNFRLISISHEGQVLKEWIRGDQDIYLESFDVHKDYFVYGYRRRGLPQISWVDLQSETARDLELGEATYSAHLSGTPEFDSKTFRFTFSSPKSPRRVQEFDTSAGKVHTLKVQKIPSGYEAKEYETEYVFYASEDGTEVPVSLLYKKGTPKDGSSRLYLTAYGSYGMSYPASFSPHRLSLVDRGFIFAMAHIRGGSDLGRRWYESGKLLSKKNTFDDFIAVAKGLIQSGYTSEKNIVIQGGSAGGMLVAAALNKAPELFGAAIAHVPFVDVLTTMLDDSLPLTPLEYTEWGHPKDKPYYDYIRSYSPYDNLRKSESFPPLLITAGLNDRRVTYWEPAKWCAKLRELHGEEAMILLKTNMGAGHGGASGRYDALKEIAEEYAFILKVLPHKS